MKNKNICKFPASVIEEPLTVSSFVKESDAYTMAAPSVLKRHRIILVSEGQGCLSFDEKQMPYHPGSLIFGFESETVLVQPKKDTVYMYVDFYGGRAEELLSRFAINQSKRIFDGYEGLIPLWEESLSSASDKTVDLAAESILLYTFSRLSVHSSERDGIVRKIVEMSEENFRDPDLSISEIAKTLAYNPKYASHIFKKKMGVSYSEYLRTLRIKYAISLFNHGIDSVKNVALLSGFTDPLYFSGVFKKNIGISPKDYISTLYEKKLENI